MLHCLEISSKSHVVASKYRLQGFWSKGVATEKFSCHHLLQGGQFDTKYFLLYYYYGGMIYAALKNYDRALYFFEVAITTPALAVSHIMLEAYKKYILVSLILHGKASD